MSRRTIASTLVALLIAGVPATALADGAGDNQYEDPLAAPTTPKKSTKKTTTTAAPTTTQTAAAAPSSTVAGTSASGSSASPSSGELPRTGAPADLLGIAGATMLAAGVALRRRTAE